MVSPLVLMNSSKSEYQSELFHFQLIRRRRYLRRRNTSKFISMLSVFFFGGGMHIPIGQHIDKEIQRINKIEYKVGLHVPTIPYLKLGLHLPEHITSLYGIFIILVQTLTYSFTTTQRNSRTETEVGLHAVTTSDQQT